MPAFHSTTTIIRVFAVQDTATVSVLLAAALSTMRKVNRLPLSLKMDRRLLAPVTAI